jgi:teichuronic acid biosynthesis protein TuaE
MRYLKLKDVIIVLLVSSVIWGSTLELFYIPGVGSVYPLRFFLIAYIAYMIVESLSYNRKIDLNRIETSVNVRFFIFWIWIIILSFLTDWTDKTFSGLIQYTMNILVITCVARIIDNDNAECIALKTIIANAICLGGLGLYECNNGIWIFRPDAPTKWNFNALGTVQPVTIFYNPNNFCMFIVMTLPVFFILTRNILSRIAYLSFVLMMILLTDCRTGIVAVIVILIIDIYHRINFLVIRILLVVSGLIIGICNILLGKKLIFGSRISIWLNTITNCFDTKLLGVGVGNGSVYNLNHMHYNAISAVGGNYIGAPHNYFLELLLEVGILGIIILMPIMFKIIKRTWANRHNLNGSYYFGIILLLGLTSVCVSTMTDFFQYWLFLGLIISFIARNER